MVSKKARRVLVVPLAARSQRYAEQGIYTNPGTFPEDIHHVAFLCGKRGTLVADVVAIQSEACVDDLYPPEDAAFFRQWGRFQTRFFLKKFREHPRNLLGTLPPSPSRIASWESFIKAASLQDIQWLEPKPSPTAIEPLLLAERSLREKYPPTLRTRDGHLVRSRAEIIVDDYLFENRIWHVYEKRLPVAEEDLYCDFYLPEHDVYIEIWGRRDQEYVARRERKEKVYCGAGLQLISLGDEHIDDTDLLVKALLQRGIGKTRISR